MEQLTEIVNSHYLNAGIFCLVLYALIKIYYKNRAVINTYKILEENEYFICDITPVMLFDYLFAFAYGHSLLQIFAFDTSETFPLYAKLLYYMSAIWRFAFAFGGIFLFTVFASPRTLITNKRIIIKSEHLLFTEDDIRSYRYQNIEVYQQDKAFIGKKFTLGFKNVKKPFVIYSINTPNYGAAVKIITDAIDILKEKLRKEESKRETVLV